jgi:hypothetical protein
VPTRAPPPRVALSDNDEAAIVKLVRGRSEFKQLDHAVGRLAQRLPNPEAKTRRMARRLAKLMAEPEPADEDEEGHEGGGEARADGEEVL